MKINITDLLPKRKYIVAKNATRNLNVQAGEFLHSIFEVYKVNPCLPSVAYIALKYKGQ